MRRFLTSLLLGGTAPLALVPTVAVAQANSQAVANDRLVLPPPQDAAGLNPSGHTVTLTVPVRDGRAHLGDISADVSPNGGVALSSARLLQLLSPLLDEKVAKPLADRGTITLADLAAAGVTLAYNAQEIALDVAIVSERRRIRTLGVTNLDPTLVGEVLRPASVSAYLNLRGNLDYLHGGEGLQSPTFLLDGATRLFGTVLESEAIWQPGNAQASFQRVGSRLVYDDIDRLMRFSAGDLRTTARSFQSAPDIAGLSVYRSYGVLEPQRIAQPRGDRSFLLTRPSTVEVQVNGQTVRRLQLDAGNYNLRDFPFIQGANDVRLAILDDAGRSQILQFNVFLDQQQLGAGLTEFGAYAGVLAFNGTNGPNYTGMLAASGYVRRGISESLTLGANAQGDRRTQMGGLEAIWSSPFGTIGATLGASRIQDFGGGYAALVTFQRLIHRGEGFTDSLNLFAERRSPDFGALGTVIPTNPFEWEAGGGYSRAFSSLIYGAIDGRYSRGRALQRDIYNARGTLGFRASSRLSLTAEARWEQDNFERRLGGYFTATLRLGASGTARADYDTRFKQARLSYFTQRGLGVGSYNFNADVQRSEFGSGFNATANYLANRAEVGFSHFGLFENTFGNSLSQRTSMRFGTSLAMADGAFAVGRPIYDSFAIVRAHPALRGANVEVSPTSFGRVADTGVLGAAVDPNLPAYVNRTITVDAPEAPPTIDLGQGAFRVQPAYRSGFKLTVGSAYNVSAVGRLVDSTNAPLSLISGTATEVGGDGRTVEVFTNKQGRFGAFGLGPGNWQIKMNDNAGSTFLLVIPKSAEGVLSVGDLTPQGGA